MLESLSKARKCMQKDFSKDVTSVLDEMSRLFINKDPLLKAQGTLPIYFLLLREYKLNNKLSKFTRNLLLDFRKKLDNNRKVAEKDIAKADFDLLQFERMSQQGTNDANSIINRIDILRANLNL